MTPEIRTYRTLLSAHADDPEPAAGASADEPRRSNLSSTIARLHLLGQQSRSELVAGLGLSRSTVGSLITELADNDVILEAGVDRQPSPGRPSQVVRINPQRAIAVAIEIGPWDVGVATVGLGGRVVNTSRVSLHGPVQDPGHITATIQGLVQSHLANVSTASRVVGVGIAMAGLVSMDGVLQHAPNLGWTRTDLRAVLAPALPAGVPVVVANESTLATVGEYLRGSLRGVHNAVMISGDIGVGGGAIVNGRLMLGADGLAGEIGHVTVDPDGLLCRCGSRGCWETRVGVEAMQRHTGMIDLPEDVDPVRALLRAAQGEPGPVVREGLDETGRWLGVGLANLANIFNPSRIVVGGRLGHLYPHLRDAAEGAFQRSALESIRRACTVVQPELGKDAALIGAAEHVFWNAINNVDVLLDDGATMTPATGRTKEQPHVA